MNSTIKTRIAKSHWAWANPDKVRDANRNYRANNRVKTNRQAAARMRRYRARKKKMK